MTFGGLGAAIAGAVAAVASAGVGIASETGAFGSPSSPKTPTAPGVDTTQILKGLLPGAKADASARAGGGISPEFLAGLTGQEAGQPGGGLSILGDIRSSLNLPQGP